MSAWTKLDPTTAPTKSYVGKLPASLYRYRSIDPNKIERLVTFEIIEESIFLAGLKDLNDPDEGRFLLEIDGSLDELVQYFKAASISANPRLSDDELQIEATGCAMLALAGAKDLPKKLVAEIRNSLESRVRVACFTTHPVNYSMWANYAKYHDPVKGPRDHAGLCIEYRCTDVWRTQNLHPVEYSDDLPTVNVLKTPESGVVEAIYRKTREWRGEEEWRIMSLINAKPPFPVDLTANSKIKVQNGVKSIIFGMNTPSETIEMIIQKVSKHKPAITYKQVRRDPLTFNRQLVDFN